MLIIHFMPRIKHRKSSQQFFLFREDALKKFVEDKKKEKPENEKNRLVVSIFRFAKHGLSVKCQILGQISR